MKGADHRAAVVATLRSHFEDFSRNGRWGTCAACPRDGAGRTLPELCPRTAQPDHQLDIVALASLFQRELIRAEAS